MKTYLFHSVGKLSGVSYPSADLAQEYTQALNVDETFFHLWAKDHPDALFTFDDGYANNLDACRFLAAEGIRCIVFVSTAFIGDPFKFCSLPIVNDEELKELSEYAEIGAHGVNHLNLTEVETDEELYFEVRYSKEYLERIIDKEVEAFSYPHGHVDHRVMWQVQKAGFKRAYATWVGNLFDDTWAIPRIGVCKTGTTDGSK